MVSCCFFSFRVIFTLKTTAVILAALSVLWKLAIDGHRPLSLWWSRGAQISQGVQVCQMGGFDGPGGGRGWHWGRCRRVPWRFLRVGSNGQSKWTRMSQWSQLGSFSLIPASNFSGHDLEDHVTERRLAFWVLGTSPGWLHLDLGFPLCQHQASNLQGLVALVLPEKIRLRLPCFWASWRCGITYSIFLSSEIAAENPKICRVVDEFCFRSIASSMAKLAYSKVTTWSHPPILLIPATSDVVEECRGSIHFWVPLLWDT